MIAPKLLATVERHKIPPTDLYSTEIPLNSFIPQWVQDINTAFGLVGFVITVVVMLQVWSIKRSFRSRARLPEIISELEKYGSALNKSLNEWPAQKNAAHHHIKVAASLIQSAVQFLPNPARKKAKTMQEKLEAAAKTFTYSKYDRADSVWDLYSDIQSIIVSLKQAARNMNWE
ncbi:hypothetical protein [Delftia acidovorans]